MPTEPASNTTGRDKWQGNRHKLYMDATLKALCDIACADAGITFSALIQKAAKRYVRTKAGGLRRKLAALPAEEQARLLSSLNDLFLK